MFLVRVIMPYLILSSIAEWYTTIEHYVFLITHLTTSYVTQDSPYATRHCVSPWWIIFVVGGFECSTTRFLWDCRRFHQWWPCSWFGFERHLPWFCAPELACWLCNVSERSSMQLVSQHGECEEGLFKVSHLSAWSISSLCLVPDRKDCWRWSWNRDCMPWTRKSISPQPRSYYYIYWSACRVRTVKGLRPICFFPSVPRLVPQPCWVWRLCFSCCLGRPNHSARKSGTGLYLPPSGTAWWPSPLMHIVTWGCEKEKIPAVYSYHV